MPSPNQVPQTYDHGEYCVLGMVRMVLSIPATLIISQRPILFIKRHLDFQSNTMLCTPLAFEIISGSVAGGNSEGIRSFKARFGCSPDVCSVLWEMMSNRRSKPRNMIPKHLLWALLFLKTYNSETVLSGVLGIERKTFRKWVWTVIRQSKGSSKRWYVVCFLLYLSLSSYSNQFIFVRSFGRRDYRRTAPTSGVW